MSPDKGMEPIVKIVMPYACAKRAPVLPSAHPRRNSLQGRTLSHHEFVRRTQ